MTRTGERRWRGSGRHGRSCPRGWPTWEVNDRAAALLTARLYTNHLRGDPDHGGPPMTPARAQSWLRDAAVADIEQFAATVGLSRRASAPGRIRLYADRPALWAPFIMVGSS